MEQIERTRAYLVREYGITTDAQLLDAIEKQQPLDIGIFVSPCGRDDLARNRKRGEYGPRITT